MTACSLNGGGIDGPTAIGSVQTSFVSDGGTDMDALTSQMGSLTAHCSNAPANVASDSGQPIDVASFLGAVMPLLAHVDSFNAQVMRISPSSDGLVVGLQGVLSALSESQSALSNPAILRSALPSLFSDGVRVKLAHASEAAEAFESLVAIFTESADQRFVACVERHFSMAVMEMCECMCDEMLEPLHYNQAAAYVSVPLLLEHARTGGVDASSALTSQLASSSGPLCPTANCGQRMKILRYLMQPMPSLLIIGLSWESTPAIPTSIHQLFSAIPATIDLQSAFKSTPQPATATLRGLLCVTSTTYYSYAYDIAASAWIHTFDGTIVGDSWASVAAACCEQHFKPSLLLYQVYPSQF